MLGSPRFFVDWPCKDDTVWVGYEFGNRVGGKRMLWGCKCADHDILSCLEGLMCVCTNICGCVG